MSSSTLYNLATYASDKLGISFFPLRTPANPVYPLGTYRRTSGTGGIYQGGQSTMRKESYEYTIYAKTMVQAEELRTDLIEALNGYAIDVLAINGSETEDYDEVNDVYEYTVSFDIVVNASLPYNTPITGRGTVGLVAIFTSPTTVTSSDAAGITGAFAVSASHANFADTAGSSVTASYLLGSIESASYALTASYAKSSSFAVSASWAPVPATASSAISSSYAVSASWAPMPVVSETASFAITASHALTAVSAAYAANVPLTASYALTSLTASYALNVPPTASWANNAVSASWAPTKDGVWSSSAQLPSGVLSSSAQIDFPDSSWESITGKPTVFSASAQVDYNGIQNTPAPYSPPSGLVSSSAQVDYNSIQNTPAPYAPPAGLVSASAQIDFLGILNQPTTIETASFVATASWALNAVSSSRLDIFAGSKRADLVYDSGFGIALNITGSTNYFRLRFNTTSSLSVDTTSGGRTVVINSYGRGGVPGVSVSNALAVSGSGFFTSHVTASAFLGNLVGNADTATSASFSTTALSSSYALTASYAANAGSGGTSIADVWAYSTF